MTKNNNTNTRVALYVRVSTEEQVNGGFGLEMQLNALREEIKHKQRYHQWIHKEQWLFIDKACTGATLKRPGYQKMMQSVQREEFDLVLVWKIDRLSRTLSDLLKTFETLQKYGVGFFSLKENIDFSGAIGKLTFQLFGALAEFERETIRSRTIEGKIQSCRMGNYIGTGIPYGYKKVPRKQGKGSVLEIVPYEAEMVKKIFRDFVFHRKNYEQIAEELNDMGVPKGVSSRKKRNSMVWFSMTIRKMLVNRIYMGEHIARIKDSNNQVQTITVKVPAIVTELQFREAEALATDVSKTHCRRNSSGHVYLLSRKIIDTETGRNFVGVPRTKGGRSYRRKSFTEKLSGKKYRNMELPAKPLDDFIWEHITMIIDNPDKFYKIYQEQNMSTDYLEDLQKEESALREKIDFQGVKITNIHNDFYDGGITENVRDSLISNCEQVIDASRTKLEKVSNEVRDLQRIKEAELSIHEFSHRFKERFEALGDRSRQILVDILIDRIEVSRDEEGYRVKVVFRFVPPHAEAVSDDIQPVLTQNKPSDGGLGAVNYVSGHQNLSSDFQMCESLKSGQRNNEVMNKMSQNNQVNKVESHNKGKDLSDRLAMCLTARVVKYQINSIWHTEIQLCI